MSTLVNWDENNKTGTTVLSDNNLTVSFAQSGSGVIANLGKTEGKWYWEINYTSATANGLHVGVSSTYNISDRQTLYTYNGSIVNGTTQSTFATAIPVGSIIGVFLDVDNKILRFYKDGVNLGEVTLNVSPPIYAYLGSATVNSVKATANFGESPFKYYPNDLPSGTIPYSNPKLHLHLLKSNNKIHSLKSEEILHETKMTSNTAPAPFVASASSVYSTTYPAWKAFNGTNVDTNDCWMSNKTKNGYLIIDFGTSKKINNIKISPRNDSGFYMSNSPKNFTLLGSQDGISYEKLDTFQNVTDWEIGKAKDFSLKKTFIFRFYRLDIIENNGADSTAIGELLFSYIENLTQLPSDSIDNYIKYGSSSIENFNAINGSKNYILQDTVSENADGLWVQELDRKPLSIIFE